MKANRVVRVILGLIVLLLFGVYSYFHLSTTPFSRDLDEAYGPVEPAPVQPD